MYKKITFLLVVVFLLLSLSACGGFKKLDMRERPVNAQERARQNVEQGKRVSINKIFFDGKLKLSHDNAKFMRVRENA